MKDDEIRKKNIRLLIGLVIFALALSSLVIILMLLRGPAQAY
ncbi:MAG: hypothetical protein ABIP97_07930 [Chthoniobacterales bacterium]